MEIYENFTKLEKSINSTKLNTEKHEKSINQIISNFTRENSKNTDNVQGKITQLHPEPTKTSNSIEIFIIIILIILIILVFSMIFMAIKLFIISKKLANLNQGENPTTTTIIGESNYSPLIHQSCSENEYNATIEDNESIYEDVSDVSARNSDESTNRPKIDFGLKVGPSRVELMKALEGNKQFGLVKQELLRTEGVETPPRLPPLNQEGSEVTQSPKLPEKMGKKFCKSPSESIYDIPKRLESGEEGK